MTVPGLPSDLAPTRADHRAMRPTTRGMSPSPYSDDSRLQPLHNAFVLCYPHQTGSRASTDWLRRKVANPSLAGRHSGLQVPWAYGALLQIPCSPHPYRIRCRWAARSRRTGARPRHVLPECTEGGAHGTDAGVYLAGTLERPVRTAADIPLLRQSQRPAVRSDDRTRTLASHAASSIERRPSMRLISTCMAPMPRKRNVVRNTAVFFAPLPSGC